MYIFIVIFTNKSLFTFIELISTGPYFAVNHTNDVCGEGGGRAEGAKFFLGVFQILKQFQSHPTR